MAFPLSDAAGSAVMVMGKGGVGKTTIACAAALHLAQNQPVHLLSTDPAHSVADMLGPEPLPESLTTEDLDAGARTDAFRDRHGDMLRAIVSHGTLFAEEEIAELLNLSFPGMDEVMAFLRLADRLPGGGEADPNGTLVVDTAPTGHTLRLLDMPDRFATWLDVLDRMLEKHRYMRSVFGSGGRDAMDAFLDDMNDRVERVLSALRDPAVCTMMVVTRPEPVVLAESRRLIADLGRREMQPSAVVVNVCDGGPVPLASPSPCWRVPPMPALATGGSTDRRDALQSLWASASPVDCQPSAPLPDDGADRPIHVDDPVAMPTSRILMIAGKGGVGKTTIAAATALASARRGQTTVLASTDPAHSLGDLFGRAGDDVPTQDVPTQVDDRLFIAEIQAEERFEALRQDYAAEVRQFFDETGGPNVDLPYDRPVAEALVNLAPPGIDEVMGWLAVMEFLDADDYHTCVIDTAPTGHFLHLLAMPDQFSEWIRALFRILRAHRDVLRLPDLTDRLVRLSRQTKRWSSMLDAGAIQCLAVSTPEPVVRAETLRLVEQVQATGAPMAALVMNRVTPPTSRTDAEQAVLDDVISRMTRASSPLPVPPRVHRTTDLHRPDRLRTLGHRLYRES